MFFLTIELGATPKLSSLSGLSTVIYHGGYDGNMTNAIILYLIENTGPKWVNSQFSRLLSRFNITFNEYLY